MKPQNTTKKRNVASSGINWQDLNLGKVPPQALDAEKAVLGAVMLDKNAVGEIVEFLRSEMFYSDKHQHIYKAVLDLYGDGEPIDLLTVSEQLRKNGHLELIGGAFALAQLTYHVSAAEHIRRHAHIISERFLRRELIRVGMEVQQAAFEDSTDVQELMDKSQQDLFDIAETNARKDVVDIRSAMLDAIKDLEIKRNRVEDLTGIGTGFTGLDRITSGWQPSDLVILAARPGMGKTAFVLTVARNAAVMFGKGVAFFSLEMATAQLVNRLIAAEAEIDNYKLKNGNFSDHDWQQLFERTTALSQVRLFIDDTPAISVMELRTKARRLRKQHDIGLIIIDYLQLMTGDKSTGNREQEISSISRSLKQLAKELNVPVIALSQLSRAVETRGGDKKPMLSDLRESGSIEQDADMVMFVFRPEYYGITNYEDGQSTNGSAEIIIAKNRHGALDTVRLRFLKEFTKFKDWEDQGFSMDMGGLEPILEVSANVGGGQTFSSKANSNLDTLNIKTDGSLPPEFDINANDVPF